MLTPEIINELSVKIKPKEGSYVTESRQAHRRAYERWSKKENELLTARFTGGVINYLVLANIFQRSLGGILSRLRKLRLISREDIDNYYNL